MYIYVYLKAVAIREIYFKNLRILRENFWILECIKKTCALLIEQPYNVISLQLQFTASH